MPDPPPVTSATFEAMQSPGNCSLAARKRTAIRGCLRQSAAA
jgi:hypothetical protein